MAITFRGSVTGSVNNGGTLSATLSEIATLAQNDVVVVSAISTSGTAATPSGWTAIKDATAVDSDVGIIGVIVYKVMGASPDTSVSFWDTGGNQNSGTAVALAFTGVDTANVLDVSVPSGVSAGTGTAPNPPSITPTSNNAAIVIYGFEANGGGTVDTTPGTVTSYTLTNITSNDDFDTSSSGGYRILSGGAGSPEDPAAWSSWSVVSGADAGAFTIALRPAADGQPFDLYEGGVPFVGNAANLRGYQLWRQALSGLLIPKRKLVFG